MAMYCGANAKTGKAKYVVFAEFAFAPPAMRKSFVYIFVLRFCIALILRNGRCDRFSVSAFGFLQAVETPISKARNFFI